MKKFLSALAAACAMLAAPLAVHAQATTTDAAASARVIVKYRADSSLLRKSAQSVSAQITAQADALGTRVGVTLRTGSALAERAQVVFATGITSEALAARIAAQPDVEYAVPDKRRHRVSAPNDPLYLSGPPIAGSSGGPAVGQWYLRAPAGEMQAAINVEPAWAITTGSPSVVVAVIDTGVRFDHPDLLTVAAGGNLLPGYDMISDIPTANDGDGRDPDPSDPGDYLTLAEVQNSRSPFYQCSDQAEDSSWHGTQTSALIGALTNNGAGMASVGRTVRILPIRVLGKCGGFDSDIIAAMLWAVGQSVPGVPANPTPARVLNLSLGGEDSCSAAYVDAMSKITAAGAVVVAAAGNSAGHATGTPANCPGVIAVAALRHVGNKVGFSDLGPDIAISAPGGNCGTDTTSNACLYPILTASNAGATTPIATASGGAIYTDAFNSSLGTSFSSPLVAGTAALMLSVRPSLTPAEVLAKLQSTARPFPTTGGDNGDGTPVLQCIAPAPIGQPQFEQGQCYCTTSTCGAGMLDAGAAVAAARGTLRAAIDVAPAQPQLGQTVTLSGAQSEAEVGRTITAYQWTLVSGGGIVAGFSGATNASTAVVVPTGIGQFTVSLTVTDNTGAQSTSNSVVSVAAASGAFANFQGLWWNSPAGSESGWGINLNHQGDTIFATWYTFGQDGKPLWMVVSATASVGAPNTFTGNLYTGTGPPFSAFDPALVMPNLVGVATFQFVDANNAVFAYFVNGATQTKQITRQVFASPVPTCTFASQPNQALATNYQDIWWNAPAGSQPGWGINLTHQGNTIFGAWFTFGADGKPLWLVVAANKTGTNTYSGTLMKAVGGPPYNAVPFNPALVEGVAAGNATLTFVNGNSGTFAYSVDGISGSKQITREVFVAPGTTCQ
jgi:serine protease